MDHSTLEGVQPTPWRSQEAAYSSKSDWVSLQKEAQFKYIKSTLIQTFKRNAKNNDVTLKQYNSPILNYKSCKALYLDCLYSHVSVAPAVNHADWREEGPAAGCEGDLDSV